MARLNRVGRSTGLGWADSADEENDIFPGEGLQSLSGVFLTSGLRNVDLLKGQQQLRDFMGDLLRDRGELYAFGCPVYTHTLAERFRARFSSYVIILFQLCKAAIMRVNSSAKTDIEKQG